MMNLWNKIISRFSTNTSIVNKSDLAVQVKQALDEFQALYNPTNDFIEPRSVKSLHSKWSALYDTVNNKTKSFSYRIGFSNKSLKLLASDFLNFYDTCLTRAYEHERYACTADELAVKIELLDYERTLKEPFKSNKEIKIAAKKHCDVLGEEINELFTKPNFSGKEYLVSYMFALELYHMYLEDKEKSLYYLKKIILLDCKNALEYYNSIKRLGVIPNISTKELHKQFTEEAIKLTRKNPKN